MRTPEEKAGLSTGETELSAMVVHNARIPELYIGAGAAVKLPRLISSYGIGRICLITGQSSYKGLPAEGRPDKLLQKAGFQVHRFPVSGEPAPETIDRITEAAGAEQLEAVVAVGGGSVLDTGKAVAVMMRHEGSVADYLEGVGEKEPKGLRAPLFALPTTAGTGSEATKNAVISRTGPRGFKKSLRHEAFVPDAALLDPCFCRACPSEITAASGLDAVTQLLEAYVSTKSTPFTAMCALDGLQRAGRWLERAVTQGDDLEARAQMSYAAYLSGIALASAGLGLVHGAAGVLGGMRPAPHGVVCGTLLKAATERIITRLTSAQGQTSGGQGQGAEPEAAQAAPDELRQVALLRYTRAAEALTGRHNTNGEQSLRELLELLEGWIDRFQIPRLGAYGFTGKELEEAAQKVSMKNTPAVLSTGGIQAMLQSRL